MLSTFPFALPVVSHTFWLVRAKANASGVCPVSLRLTRYGQRTEVATGVRCHPSQWLTKASRLRETGAHVHPEAPQLNRALDALEARIVLLRHSLPTDATLADFRHALLPPPPPETPDALLLLAAACEQHSNMATRTAACGALRKLRCYVVGVPINTRKPPGGVLPVDELTPAYAAKFSLWLASGNSAGHCLAMLRGLWALAFPGQPSPFAKLSATKQKPAKPRYVLTTAQFQALEKLPLAAGRQALSRDVYLAQYYLHGSRVGVVLELTWQQVDWTTRRVRFKAEKGGGWHNVALRPALEVLLRRYWRAGATGLVFPLLPPDYLTETPARRFRLRNMAEAAVWQGLRRVGVALGLPAGVLHSHTARHTLATHTVERTGSVRTAQQMLGHSSVSMTERYVKNMCPTELDQAGDTVYGIAQSA